MVASHVALVRKIVVKFKQKYSIKADPELDAELLAAGCVGLLRAVSGFDPDKGRFATFAWKWIFGEIRNALLAYSSPIKTPAGLKPHHVRSLDAPLRVRNGADHYDNSVGVLHDSVADTALGADHTILDSEEADRRDTLIADALKVLSVRERRILKARRLSDPTVTLDALAAELSVSRERVRQIEAAAISKLGAEVTRLRAARPGGSRREVLKPTLSWLPNDRLARAYRDQNLSPETAAALAANRDARVEAAHRLPGATAPSTRPRSPAGKRGGNR